MNSLLRSKMNPHDDEIDVAIMTWVNERVAAQLAEMSDSIIFECVLAATKIKAIREGKVSSAQQRNDNLRRKQAGYPKAKKKE